MTIAIVIGTHGWAAEQLLKTAEMLLGEQENVGWIDVYKRQISVREVPLVVRISCTIGKIR